MTRKKTTPQFIEDAINIHGNTYDYSKVSYINNRTKVEIICKEHGSFLQIPNSHLSNKRGCPICGQIKCSKSNTKTKTKFLKDANGIHGTTYDYSLVHYITGYHKVELICKEHGSFWQIPKNHLNGFGCAKCGGVFKKDTRLFIEDATGIYGDLYSYSKTNYINNKTRVEIICKIHGSFWQKPNGHLSNQGCPKCASSGFDTTKPAILYYLSVKGHMAYKIGITNRSVNERYSNEELQDIEIIEEWEFENGQEAYDKEQEILKRYKHLKYVGIDLLKSGNTEMFREDVLTKLKEYNVKT